jgi:hypothetical protein
MAVCFKCSRVLSANGSCLYCGTSSGADAAGDRGGRRRVNWLRRILVILLCAVVFHFLFLSPTGRNLLRPIFEKTGLSAYISL